MKDMKSLLEGWLDGDISPPPVADLVGITLLSCGSGQATASMTAGERHHNPMGIVHGGILCDLADVAMGVAAASTMGEAETFSTTNLSISYLRPVVEALLIAEAEVVLRGKNVIFLRCSIQDEEGSLIAQAASTCHVRGRLSRSQ
jgi:uncharacterized protein (TIGR00369 family)